MANEIETGSLDDLMNIIKGMKDIPESAQKDCLEDLCLQKTDETAWMRKVNKRLEKGLHVISEPELPGNSQSVQRNNASNEDVQESADRPRQARAEAEKKKASKSRQPSEITLEDFQKAVIGLDSHKAAVIMNVCGDEDDEVTYDCDLRGPHGTVVVSGSFQTDDDGKIVSIEEPSIEGVIHSQDDCETVYARLLRRFQGERAFTPKDSPSIWF